MKLPWYVISKGLVFDSFPILGKATAQSIGPFIFMPVGIYKNLRSQQPDPRHVALLIHEETHRKRQKEVGFIKFSLQYIFNPKFRFTEELLAVKEAMKYLKKNKIPFDFESKAKFMSSYVYLWPVSKDYAKNELKKVWDNILLI